MASTDEQTTKDLRKAAIQVYDFHMMRILDAVERGLQRAEDTERQFMKYFPNPNDPSEHESTTLALLRLAGILIRGIDLTVPGYIDAEQETDVLGQITEVMRARLETLKEYEDEQESESE